MRIMELDPMVYTWKGGESLFSYSFSMGRKMLKISKPKINIVKKKWARGTSTQFQI
jgi:hypothetical protein